ncbi:Peroxisome chaperone and import receptor [Vermiconidia calcicola]|uniref:Peroxisome chaperone and import receptor n=1 Tax=Vermiconidia calcicola TaxID=1690605 RepID=A0ACC3MYY6_9PEZI|nr:Peroxisome chaperone and import receptor [Vermiconidia calcicola]
MADKAKQEEVETAPDLEEDELDDLDDVLDSFNAKSAKPAPPPTTTAPTAGSGPGRPSSSESTAVLDDAGTETDMAAQLQAGMAGLISELGENPEMQKQFEDMMQELVAAGAASTDREAVEHIRKASDNMPVDPDLRKDAAGGGGDGKKEKEAKFQDTIRKTMERMQQSGDAATAATSSSGAQATEEDMLMEMMKSLGGGAGGGGEGGEEDFNSMLMSMMTQLTNKEILYEPMKELHEKFPAWMEKHAADTEKKELERFKEQQRLVGEIVGRFERKGYTDEDEGDREFIVERMQKMQAAGSPPPDLVGDMSAAQEALGNLESGCPTQ